MKKSEFQQLDYDQRLFYLSDCIKKYQNGWEEIKENPDWFTDTLEKAYSNYSLTFDEALVLTYRTLLFNGELDIAYKTVIKELNYTREDAYIDKHEDQ